MNTPVDDTCAAALTRAMTLARGGSLSKARAVLLEIFKTAPEQPDALQLMGLVERSAGDNLAAERWLRRSLELAPNQPHVLNNLGNILMDLGRHADALDAYRQALDLKPDDKDALVNYGRAALETGSPATATGTLERAVSVHPGHRPAWTALAEARKALGQFRDGIAAARRALALQPGHAPSLAILGLCQRFVGDTDAAIRTLERAVAGDSANPSLHCALAYACCEAGRVEPAIAAFRQAIRLQPDCREAHDGLNDLLWQYGRRDRYMTSYPAALRKCPRTPALWADWAWRLSLAGRNDEALSLLHHAQAHGVDSPALDHRRGQIQCALGNHQAGIQAYRQALEKDPADMAARVDILRALLASQDFAGASAESDIVLARAPYHQEAIAYQGLAWRFLGDPRAARLNDYDRFVAEMDLEPQDTGSRRDFNDALARRIRDLHTATHCPAEQTLRGGTQTMGNLLDREIAELVSLRRMLASAIHRYISALPADDKHVFLRRKCDDFRFSGSWSVRLQPGGYHLNHVHSHGWISACYYLEVPDSISDPGSRQGWLQLGQSNLALGDADRPARHVQPAPGRLVLFPSYMYHGTVPFHGDAPRTTIAFDIVPA